MAHFEDYELAQSIHGELLELRARANSATSVELSVIAAKAELPTNWQPQEDRATVDDARTNAWLAICRLASETANNETAAEDECPQRYHISKERDREPFELQIAPVIQENLRQYGNVAKYRHV